MNNTKPLISVVLPSFNDEGIIQPHYEAITSVLNANDKYDFELIYVDDGSSDGSQETLANIAKNDPKVTFVELVRNFGQQRALFVGVSESKGDYVVTLDGDFQYHPRVILDLVEAMGTKYDIVSGIRTRRKGRIYEKWPSQIANKVIQKSLGVDVQDFGSVKAFSRSLVNKIIKLRHCYSDVYPAAFSISNNVVEIPVQHKERYMGESHWNIWMRFRVYLDIYVAYGRDELELPFRFGVYLTLFGIFLLFFSFAFKTILSHEATYAQLGILSTLLALLGVFFAFWSLVMSFVIRIYRENIWGEMFMLRRIIRDRQEQEVP